MSPIHFDTDLLKNTLRSNAQNSPNFHRSRSPSLYARHATLQPHVDLTATLTKGEFVDIIVDMIGEDASDELVSRLVAHIRGAMHETAEQRAERIAFEAQQRETADLRQTLNEVFDKWDNDCSGYLDFEELKSVFYLWKGSRPQEAEALATEALSYIGEKAPAGRMRRPGFIKCALFS